MIKKIQKPFDLEAWKNGAKIETRDGRQVRILCTNAKVISATTPQPILGLISEDDNEEVTETWTVDGHYSAISNKNDANDLVIVEEIEESERWADDENAEGEGWYHSSESGFRSGTFLLNEKRNYDVFATEKQAKSALAMARISQLMAHDERYGGVVTEEDWRSGLEIYALENIDNHVSTAYLNKGYFARHFLAFHTPEQRELFLKENEQLVKDYLMIG